MTIHSLAGKKAPLSLLIDPKKVINGYYSEIPDVTNVGEKVKFGTSGHRGSSLKRSFNETHILAITQAICEFRKKENIEGPLFLGIDTHALSVPAFQSAIEVLVANEVDVMISEGEKFTPTPVISHAILCYNKSREKLADGIVVTPSHNPPAEGGFKYNFIHGGPADVQITSWIESRANELIRKKEKVRKVPFEKAISSQRIHRYNYLKHYVDDLKNIVDLEIISKSKLKIGIDPLGGAGVHYWKKISDQYGLHFQIINETIDPTFSFMSVDWDGQIRMDPSSPYAMQQVIEKKDQFDIICAADTDHDRHGIVTRSAGLLPTNHYLSVAIDYLFQNRPEWNAKLGIGKTVVSSQMIDRVAKKLNRDLYEVPVGFKWFVDGLHQGKLGFCGEESAGASFLRKDGTVWSTDKDGIILCLLAAEMTAKLGKDPGELYTNLTKKLGSPIFDRVEAKATFEQKEKLKKLSAKQVQSNMLAGEKIEAILTNAPGNQAPIGGIKIQTRNGWFAARPSGTEEIYKIYAESFLSKDHLDQIIQEAQTIVNAALEEI